MKQVYASPVICVHHIDLTTNILAGSGNHASTNYSPDRDYNCPYVQESHYCKEYSEYMNAFRKSIEYAAQHKTNTTFYEFGGCPRQNTCGVYKLYLFKKQHENNGK